MQFITLDSERLTPSKVVCVGRNYTAHIAELNNETPDEMVLFNKPNSAITHSLKALHNDDVLHYETELCFVVKNKKFVGIGLGLDLTKRTVQSKLKNKGLPWERAKAFDGSVIFSDFIVVSDSTQQFTFELKINGVVTQQGDTHFMLHKPDAILQEISEFMHLDDGDVVMTGTPSGVGEVVANSTFTVALFANEQCLLEQQWKVVQS
ncbi:MULTISPECIES: fumarylacetoacetate hydrolase family protein [unclassified Pseudoalteromonas]|uniref:fumarylacetoacetate hydrolase family protein n=1 Tax=unclassified Pseudoalteromonas TaxID=194690 RepID=UPI001107EE30|nr:MULTISPECIES: fumarylacetoacetate hydrolase family protein [unclassified Pseudoalteromonas]TMN84341.1 FAA hydrolase family protein [Pseudoalteromonas sp. S410]TMN88663.1 FAA hydrolase family protein [Pseudoalteromonas sp. S408]TMN95704.1 FAA hydrolase family protein [Pseudoalteromonas sp. S407]TMN98218.1 FAA hydrolase family protein [Pseudoalteromonas sp. S409]TMO12091.1 FAA hydrolase family protein [Pseudoalteromonas sp. S186]